jgi:hypothetical protein
MSTIVFYLLNEQYGEKVYKHVQINPGELNAKVKHQNAK